MQFWDFLLSYNWHIKYISYRCTTWDFLFKSEMGRSKDRWRRPTTEEKGKKKGILQCVLYSVVGEKLLKRAFCPVLGLSINMNFAYYPWICSKTDPRSEYYFFRINYPCHTSIDLNHSSLHPHFFFLLQILLSYQLLCDKSPPKLNA